MRERSQGQGPCTSPKASFTTDSFPKEVDGRGWVPQGSHHQRNTHEPSPKNDLNEWLATAVWQPIFEINSWQQPCFYMFLHCSFCNTCSCLRITFFLFIRARGSTGNKCTGPLTIWSWNDIKATNDFKWALTVRYWRRGARKSWVWMNQSCLFHPSVHPSCQNHHIGSSWWGVPCVVWPKTWNRQRNWSKVVVKCIRFFAT